ncbi:MAG TPA: hypothetical protein VHD33_01750, partial [Legionellaceae bacterium]|nr:hypothetical protein [Legionellaceae bacterium]
QFLYYDRIYTKALLAVFALCVSFLVPGFLPIVLKTFCSTSGTIFCMAANIVYRSARARLKMTQCQENKSYLKKQEQAYFEEFLALNVQKAANHITRERMEALYLELIKIGAKINFETASMQYERLELMRTTLLRFLVPTLIGLSMIYAPATVLSVPTYVFVLAASALLAYVLDKMAKQYQPEEVPDAFSLQEKQFQNYCQTPKIFSTYADTWFANPRCSYRKIAADNASISMTCTDLVFYT